MSEFGQVDVVFGTQRGDEAKARWVVEQLDTGQYGYSARYNGADNAGHTTDINGDEINLHQVPTGILMPSVVNLITKASFVNPTTLLDEIDTLKSKGVSVSPENLAVSHAAHLILPHHVMLDQLREQSKGRQGSTSKGISFVARDKGERIGVRVEELVTDSDRLLNAVIDGLEYVNAKRIAAGIPDLEMRVVVSTWYKKAKNLARYITDTTTIIREAIQVGDNILAEGAQSFGLDIDHGTYPYVTSSNTGVAAVQNSLGIGPKNIGNVFGAVKAIKSSVGAPRDLFPTLMDNELADKIRGNKGEIDAERGKSTGRERELGWLDIPELRTAIAANGVTELFLAKLDWTPKTGITMIAESYTIDGKIVEFAPSDSADHLRKAKPNYITLPTWDTPIDKIRDFDELPPEARRYITTIEDLVGVPITKIGVGPYRGQFINRPARS